jgi:hypothetical protein
MHELAQRAAGEGTSKAALSLQLPPAHGPRRRWQHVVSLSAAQSPSNALVAVRVVERAEQRQALMPMPTAVESVAGTGRGPHRPPRTAEPSPRPHLTTPTRAAQTTPRCTTRWREWSGWAPAGSAQSSSTRACWWRTQRSSTRRRGWQSPRSSGCRSRWATCSGGSRACGTSRCLPRPRPPCDALLALHTPRRPTRSARRPPSGPTAAAARAHAGGVQRVQLDQEPGDRDQDRAAEGGGVRRAARGPVPCGLPRQQGLPGHAQAQQSEPPWRLGSRRELPGAQPTQ